MTFRKRNSTWFLLYLLKAQRGKTSEKTIVNLINLVATLKVLPPTSALFNFLKFKHKINQKLLHN